LGTNSVLMYLDMLAVHEEAFIITMRNVLDDQVSNEPTFESGTCMRFAKSKKSL
jgi:hypothetical protein